MSPRGVVIIPIGLIIRLIGGFISLSIRLLGALFAILLYGTAGQRVYLLLLLAAPVAGFHSVKLLRFLPDSWAFARRAPAPAAEPAGSPAPVDTAPRRWVTASADGAAELVQEQTASGCRISCRLAGNQVWAVDGECQSELRDLRFVANDCVLSATFFGNPAPAAHRLFIQVYQLGLPQRAVLDLGLTRDAAALRAAHLISGMHGNPGAPPRYSATGDAVELSIIDGTETRVPLVPPAPAAAKGKPPRKPR